MTDQKAVTATLFDQWDVISRLVADLGEAQWRLPTALPGWDVHAVVAHLVGTESMLLGEPSPAADIAAAHIRNPIAAFNEQWVAALRPLPGAELAARFRAVADRRRAALAAMTPAQWDAIAPNAPTGPDSYGGFMRTRVFDCWMHELDIRDAVGMPGDEGGPRGELAIAVLTGGLGYAVGKLGKAPAGATVTFELSGPLARTLHIAVTAGPNGKPRAAMVDAPTEPATVTLGLDSGLFVRLAGGRTAAAAHPGEVTVTGDPALATRLLDNLAFTI